MKKGAKAYLAASFVSQGAALVRFVVLSRIIGPEELGLATLLILTSQFFELVTDAASDRFMVQDPEGHEPRLQSVVQAAMFARGVLLAVAIALVAPFAAQLFDAPELTPALFGLALTPLIGGLVHTDVYRAQRANNFGPASLFVASSELAGLVGTATAAFIVRDHTAILYGLLLRAITMVIVSHAVAERPYRWAYARAEAQRFIAFALPLFLNGFLLFLGTQGDRLLINGLGKAELGRYSAVQLLIFYPTAIALRFLVNIHLPGLSASRDNGADFFRASETLAGRTALICLAMAIGFAAIGPFVTPILYGPAFTQVPIIFALLAAQQALRTLRLWPTTMALAIGRTTIAAVDNGVRLIALPLAFVLMQIKPGVVSILAGFTAGEALALLVTFFLINRAAEIGSRSGLIRIGEFLAVCAAIIAAAWAIEARQMVWFAGSLAAGGAALAVLMIKERTVVVEGLAIGRETLGGVLRRGAGKRDAD